MRLLCGCGWVISPARGSLFHLMSNLRPSVCSLSSISCNDDLHHASEAGLLQLCCRCFIYKTQSMVLGNQRGQHLKKVFLANYAYWWIFFWSSIRMYTRLMLIGRKKLQDVLINTDLWKKVSTNNPPNYTKKCCSLKISHFWTHVSPYFGLKYVQ